MESEMWTRKKMRPEMKTHMVEIVEYGGRTTIETGNMSKTEAGMEKYGKVDPAGPVDERRRIEKRGTSLEAAPKEWNDPAGHKTVGLGQRKVAVEAACPAGHAKDEV